MGGTHSATLSAEHLEAPIRQRLFRLAKQGPPGCWTGWWPGAADLEVGAAEQQADHQVDLEASDEQEQEQEQEEEEELIEIVTAGAQAAIDREATMDSDDDCEEEITTSIPVRVNLEELD